MFDSGGGFVAQYQDILTTVEQIRKLGRLLKTADEVLSARMNAQVTASTDSDADYAAEVADGRADAWGNVQGSLGSNIRDGQNRLSLALELLQAVLQGQIDELSESRLEDTLNIAYANETRRQELAREEEHRIADDDSLQRQINTLSEAVLGILATISETREEGRNK